MRILTTPFVEKWQGRLINIHPCAAAVLQGARHAPARARGRRAHPWLHGAFRDRRRSTTGRSSPRPRCRCWPATARQALAARVLKAEHQLYPLALRLVAEGRAQVRERPHGVRTLPARPSARPRRWSRRTCARSPRTWKIWRASRREGRAATASRNSSAPHSPARSQQQFPLRVDCASSRQPARIPAAPRPAAQA